MLQDVMTCPHRARPLSPLGLEATEGIDWIRWIISILVAAVFVMIAAAITGQRRGRLTGRRGKAL
jgi:hypothetical protein